MLNIKLTVSLLILHRLLHIPPSVQDVYYNITSLLSLVNKMWACPNGLVDLVRYNLGERSRTEHFVLAVEPAAAAAFMHQIQSGAASTLYMAKINQKSLQTSFFRRV